MSYLLCPQIQRVELAVKVSDGLNTNAAKLDARKETVLFNKKRVDQTKSVAEMNQCLKTWNLMRGKDKNVRRSISLYMTTQCSFHKQGQAALYAAASMGTTNFLTCLLCPKIKQNEVAMTVDERVTLDEVNETY